jgi:hypothetical protein
LFTYLIIFAIKSVPTSAQSIEKRKRPRVIPAWKLKTIADSKAENEGSSEMWKLIFAAQEIPR